MIKRRFNKKSIPSHFPPVYHSRKPNRSSKFKLLLSRATRPKNISPIKYVNQYRLSSSCRRSKSRTTPLNYFYSFKKNSWVFTPKARVVNTHALSVISSPLLATSVKPPLFLENSNRTRPASLPAPYFFFLQAISGARKGFRATSSKNSATTPLAGASAYGSTSTNETYCAYSSVSGWFFLKKLLSRLVSPSRNMVLGYGLKRFIIEDSIFYPHAENVRVFRSLVFCSFHSTSEHAFKEAVSCGSLLSLLLGFRRYSFRKLIGLPLNRSILYTLRVRKSSLRRARGVNKPNLSLSPPRRKSSMRHKIVLRQLIRLKWRLRKNRNVIRRVLNKLTARINSSRPPRPRSLERYNLPRLFTLVSKKIVPSSIMRFRNNHAITRNAGRAFVQNYIRDLLGSNCRFKPTPSSKERGLLYFFSSPFFFKTFFFRLTSSGVDNFGLNHSALLRSFCQERSLTSLTNLSPVIKVQSVLVKKILANQTNAFLQKHALPWAHNSLIRFMEDCSGKRVMLQIYSFITQNIDSSFLVLYRRWMPRMRYYEQRLGHKFFLGEALSIMHLSFTMHDPKLLISWFSAIIKRISFWKTRLVFRFFRYLIQNYFSKLFTQLQVKGIKVRLKGKISVSGNSRKRTILYRAGLTSHSTTSLKVLNESTLINTFTGVMGFQIWLFY